MNSQSILLRPRPFLPAIRSTLVLPVVLALAGCVATPMTPSVQAPSRSAAAPSPYRTAPEPSAVQPAPVPVVPAAPAAPAYSGATDSRTGLRQAAVVAVTGNEASGYTVLFRPARTEPASVDAAPRQLCGDAGVASSRTNAPGSSSAMPGVQIMIVKCGAA